MTWEEILESIDRIKKDTPEETWREAYNSFLNASVDFDLHLKAYQKIFASDSTSAFERPVWYPSSEVIEKSNIGQLMAECNLSSFEAFYDLSIRDQERFLDLMLKRLGIKFESYPSSMLKFEDVEKPCWFEGGNFNIVESCFNADPTKIAIIEHVDGQGVSQITYAQLFELMGKVMNTLKEAGIKPGQRVGLAMPMSARSTAVYLAVIAMGCSIVTVAESFSTEEIKVRFEIAQPVLVFTQDAISRGDKSLPLYPKVAQAIDACETCEAGCIVSPLGEGVVCDLRSIDQAWDKWLGKNSEVSYEYADAHKEITLLFSSGTTGNPKAIPWIQATALRAANDAHLHQDLHPGDIACWPTSFGWMMGPWLVLGTLLNQSTIAYSNASPTSRSFTAFIQDAKVNMLGLVPSLVSAWRSSGALEGLDLDAIKLFSSTGECSNAEDMFYLMSRANYRPVIEYCGGTELGGAYISSTVVQPSVAGAFSTPALGTNMVLLNDEGLEAETGEVFLIPPVLGSSIKLLNKDHHESYFQDTPKGPNGEVLRRHGDQLQRNADGYYRAQGRTDDSMNLGGIKVSSVQIEELVAQVGAVKECAAIAVNPSGGGPSQLNIVAVLNEDRDQAELLSEMQQLIKTKLNPLFKINALHCIDTLPRTASNKIMRRELRDRFEEVAT